MKFKKIPKNNITAYSNIKLYTMIPNHSPYLFMNKQLTNIARGSKKDIVLCIAICIMRIIIIIPSYS